MIFAKKNILIVTLFPVVFASCVVSKKKYEELEYAKRRSDSKVRTLTKENKALDDKINSTLAEFNEMKNSMAESNAMKTSEIDALSTEVMGLASDTTQIKERLVNTLSLYDEAQKRNLQNIVKISEMGEVIKRLKADSLNLRTELKNFKIETEWEKKNTDSEKAKLTEIIKEMEDKIEALSKDLEEVNNKNLWLRKVNTKNDEEIEKLSNQIKLYKKELDKVSRGNR